MLRAVQSVKEICHPDIPRLSVTRAHIPTIVIIEAVINKHNYPVKLLAVRLPHPNLSGIVRILRAANSIIPDIHISVFHEFSQQDRGLIPISGICEGNIRIIPGLIFFLHGHNAGDKH